MFGTVGTDEDKLLLEALKYEFINVDDDCDEANDDGEPFEITGDKLLGTYVISKVKTETVSNTNTNNIKQFKLVYPCYYFFEII